MELEEQENRVAFDAYFIAEGGWSYSTAKLGFCKAVVQRKPTIGIVLNLKYNKEDAQERQMKSFLKHALSKDFPLRNCPILAEFVEYLKGETHFFALVACLEKPKASEEYDIDAMEASGQVTPEVAGAMRDQQSRMGLLDMGVIKEKRPKATLLAPDNVDVDKLHEMGRIIAKDCGLPDTAEFFHTNPVQMFDFSSLGRCELPCKFLCGDGSVVDSASHEASAGPGTAMVFPVGDSLQEPLWTSGLGVNRGFHGGLNAVYAALLAREQGCVAASSSIHESWDCMLKMQWGDGRLAGGGSGSSGVKPGDKWTAEPSSRLPLKTGVRRSSGA
jgi:hypothetical protein